MFIIGLPRSRTAWLSVFMSQSKTKFHHEAINGCNNLEEYKDKIRGRGDCTTAFSLLNGGIITRDTKVVIINKNKEQMSKCIRWCDGEFGGDNLEFINGLNDQILKFNGLSINQSDINGRLKEIWEYLVDDTWYESYSDMVKFNIQVASTGIDKEAAIKLYETI